MPIQNFSTDRLLLSPISENDTLFMLELVNTPGWLRFIGDRNVHSEADALAYIHKIDSLTDVHYWVVKRKSDSTSLGVVTFIKRFYLPHFDIGFAFLPQYAGHGYAYEASAALMQHLQQDPLYQNILATTLPENDSSIKLLQKLGMHFEREIEADNLQLHVYATSVVEEAALPQ